MSLVSIIMPLHNKGQYLAETLRSVRSQSIKNWECIVVENHSSDDGPGIAAKLAEKDERIRLLQAPDMIQGPGAARNYGLDRASGGWVLFLDADDVLLPCHLQTLLEIAENPEKSPDVVASDWVEFQDGTWKWESAMAIQDSDLSEMTLHFAGGRSRPPSRISLQESSVAFAPWALHCGMIRREALDETRRWVEKLDCYPSEDTAFWFRILWGRRVAYTNKATALYRTETANFRNTFHDLDRWSLALEGIHSENVRYLKSLGKKVNSNQAECLMRVWSRQGEKTLQAGMHEISTSAYRFADHWRKKISRISPGVVCRHLLGCRNFDRLRDVFVNRSVAQRS